MSVCVVLFLTVWRFLSLLLWSLLFRSGGVSPLPRQSGQGLSMCDQPGPSRSTGDRAVVNQAARRLGLTAFIPDAWSARQELCVAIFCVHFIYELFPFFSPEPDWRVSAMRNGECSMVDMRDFTDSYKRLKLQMLAEAVGFATVHGLLRQFCT